MKQKGKLLSIMSISLFLDCSLRENTIILKVDEDVQIERVNGRLTLEKLVPTIQTLLNNKKLSYNDINYIYITEGPGSSTGLRLGMTFVKTILLLNKNIKVRVVNLYKEAMNRFKDKKVVTFDRHNDLISYEIVDKGNGEEGYQVKINKDSVDENLCKQLVFIGEECLENTQKVSVESLLLEAKLYKELTADTIGLMKPLYPYLP